MLKKEPRARSKEDLKALEGYLTEYLKKVLFDPLSSGEQYKKFTDQQQEMIIQEILRNSVKLHSIPFGQRLT